jgi:HK97 family phage portal protein
VNFGPDIRFGFDNTPARESISNAISISSGGQSMLDLFGTSPGAVGPAVTDTTAMQVGTVYACLEKLGGVVLQLPLHHYRMNPAGERERVSPISPIWWLLNESPSPAWTAASWKEWIVRCVKLRGDQHTQILRSRAGDTVGLLPLHPDCVQPRTVDKRLRYDVWDVETGRAYGVDQDDMLHFTGFGFDGEKSISAIKWAARNAISNALSAASYMGKALSEHGMPRVSLEYPNQLNVEQAKLARDSFVSAYLTNDSKHRLPLVLTNGGKANPLTISPVDMELMAARKMDKGEICEALGVPPIIIGDSEKTSSWGTGVEQVTLGWVRFSVQPMLARWEEEMNRKLFRRAGQFVEFSLEALLRGDSKAQADAYRAALGGPGTGDGWLAVNEVRKIQNRPKFDDTAFDLPFRAQRTTSSARSAPPHRAPLPAQQQ